MLKSNHRIISVPITTHYQSTNGFYNTALIEYHFQKEKNMIRGRTKTLKLNSTNGEIPTHYNKK